MKPFKIKNVLIPVDFSETANHAIEHGGFMAELFGSELILFHVIEDNWQSFKVIDSAVGIKDLTAFANKVEKKLAEVASEIKKNYGVESQVVCTSGNICNEIVSAVKEYDADVIVMGTHGVSGFEEFFAGSNTYKVVNRSACPVISVQSPPKKKGFQNILLPIDLSQHTLQKVDFALSIAEKYASKIHIAGLLSEGEDSKKFDLKLEQIVKHIKKSKIVVSCEKFVGDNQAKMTLEYSDKIKADLVVIMTDQDENISGRFIGPYAQQIVNHSRIAVMSIPPYVNPKLIEDIHPY